MTIQNPKSEIQNPTAFSVFRNRNFTLLWSSELVSQIGTALSSLAAAIWVYQLTGSSLSVGLMLIASVAPSLLVGLVAGVFVDRMDRRRIMIAANLIRAVLVLLIPFLLPHNIAWLYILTLCSNAVGQFFSPAHASLLPEVASDEELTAANSMMAISSFGSMAVGFAASGFIAGTASIEWAFYLDSLSFVVSAIFVYPAACARPRAGGRDHRGRGRQEPGGRHPHHHRHADPALLVHGLHPGLRPLRFLEHAAPALLDRRAARHRVRVRLAGSHDAASA